MTLHDLAHFFHHVVHRHASISREAGEFVLCQKRLPWAAATDVRFRPDFSGAGWYHVPPVHDSEQNLLFTRIAQAGDAYQAMAILRAAYAEMSEGKARARA